MSEHKKNCPNKCKCGQPCAVWWGDHEKDIKGNDKHTCGWEDGGKTPVCGAADQLAAVKKEMDEHLQKAVDDGILDPDYKEKLGDVRVHCNEVSPPAGFIEERVSLDDLYAADADRDDSYAHGINHGTGEWTDPKTYEHEPECVSDTTSTKNGFNVYPTNDPVNHPAHYTQGKFETIEVIEDWKLNYHLATAVKYISRAEHKGNAVQDIEKAIWYLQRWVDTKAKTE